jgi:hypothetical protein
MVKNQVMTDECTCISLKLKENDQIAAVCGAVGISSMFIWWRTNLA